MTYAELIKELQTFPPDEHVSVVVRVQIGPGHPTDYAYGLSVRALQCRDHVDLSLELAKYSGPVVEM